MKPAGATNKSATIRAVLKRAGRPLTIYVLLERMENRLKQIISKQRLYSLLTFMRDTGEIVTEGRGDENRTYALLKPRLLSARAKRDMARL